MQAVYIASHGAAAAVGDDDPDASIARLVRRHVGPGVPIIGTLDLHANVSTALLAATDALVGYRTNPHVDQRERGAEAASLVHAALAGARLVQAGITLPFMPATVTLLTNEAGPMQELLALAREAETDPVVSASVLGGFPFADVPRQGMSVLAVARDGERAAAEAVVRRLAEAAWARRARFERHLMPLQIAANLARGVADDRKHPAICLSDAGDNPGGGGQGNSDALLAALHQVRAKGAVLANFCDPPLAADAHAMGPDGEFQAVFNRVEAPFAHRLEAPARVLALSDGNGVGRRGSIAGRRFALGQSALLELLPSGVRVLVCSLRRQCHDPAMLELLGIDVGAVRVLAVKSRGHFRAGFDTYFPSERIYEVDTPGFTSPVLTRFQFRNLRRPIYPLDPETAWSPPPGS